MLEWEKGESFEYDSSEDGEREGFKEASNGEIGSAAEMGERRRVGGKSEEIWEMGIWVLVVRSGLVVEMAVVVVDWVLGLRAFLVKSVVEVRWVLIVKVWASKATVMAEQLRLVVGLGVIKLLVLN